MDDQTDKPVADPVSQPASDFKLETEHLPAAARLRAFEDEHFGKDAVRIRGHIEKGYGSPFKAMPEQKHAEYAALEKLVAAEQKVVEANAALSAAEVAHDAAVAELDAASQAATPKGESSAGLE